MTLSLKTYLAQKVLMLCILKDREMWMKVLVLTEQLGWMRVGGVFGGNTAFPREWGQQAQYIHQIGKVDRDRNWKKNQRLSQNGGNFEKVFHITQVFSHRVFL